MTNPKPTMNKKLRQIGTVTAMAVGLILSTLSVTLILMFVIDLFGLYDFAMEWHSMFSAIWMVCTVILGVSTLLFIDRIINGR